MLNLENSNLGVGSVNKVLLTEQDVAKRLGVPKKDVQAMISAGILPVIALPGRNLISSVAIDNLIGKKEPVYSGQLGHGYPLSNALYYHQENNMIDSEDEIMREYTGNVSVLSDGRCMVQINLGKGPDGKRKRESKSFKSKVDAEKYLEQRLNELNGLFANAYPFVNNEWRKELNKMPPAMKNSKFVFPSEEGDFKSYTSVKSILQRFLKHYDLKYIKFTLYRFRHTMCTRLALDGIPVSVAQRIMGDNTIDVIMKVYTHVSNQQALEACGPLLDKVNEVHRAMSRKHID